jgi:hypothetical protein
VCVLLVCFTENLDVRVFVCLFVCFFSFEMNTG